MDFRKNHPVLWAALALLGLTAALCLVACKGTVNPVASLKSETAMGGGAQKELTDASKKLMDAISKPDQPFHMSYKAQENINPKFPMQANSKPEVGPLEVEADVSPDEVSVTETKNGKKTETKGDKSDQMGLPMARLAAMSPLIGSSFALAIGSIAARPAGADTVGGNAADKIEFDTASAPLTAQAGLAMMGAMLGGKAKIKGVKGTAWVDKASGRLAKFNIDTDFAAQDGTAWKEHYEAEITPK